MVLILLEGLKKNPQCALYNMIYLYSVTKECQLHLYGEWTEQFICTFSPIDHYLLLKLMETLS